MPPPLDVFFAHLNFLELMGEFFNKQHNYDEEFHCGTEIKQDEYGITTRVTLVGKIRARPNDLIDDSFGTGQSISQTKIVFVTKTLTRQICLDFP